jgi:hypothetical protein
MWWTFPTRHHAEWQASLQLVTWWQQLPGAQVQQQVQLRQQQTQHCQQLQQ